MKRWLLGAMVSAYAMGVHADLTQVYHTFIIFSEDLGARQWYNASGSGNPALPASLGEFDFSQTLHLGGQARTQDTGAGTTVTMFWRIREADTANTVNFGDFSLPYRNTPSNYDRWEQHPVPGSTPGSTSHDVNLLDGLAAGDYDLSIWFNATRGSTTVWDSDGGNNYNTSFSVIPEPGTMALLGIGLLSAWGLRRRLR